MKVPFRKWLSTYLEWFGTSLKLEGNWTQYLSHFGYSNSSLLRQFFDSVWHGRGWFMNDYNDDRYNDVNKVRISSQHIIAVNVSVLSFLSTIMNHP